MNAPLALPLPYPVVVGAGAADALGALVTRHAPAHRTALLVDARVAALHGERLAAAFADAGAHPTLQLAVPSGEAHKTRETWMRLTDELLSAKCGRDTTIVAIGGGVTGDLAGFVAATLHRGVPFVQVPTTLLAMVDASIGGKTGVDTPAGKNLVGAFHDPSLVVADPTFLATLPAATRREGVAEMLKHGVALDASHFAAVREAAHALAEATGDELVTLAPLVAASVALKARVVEEDRLEGGRRQVLNAGHTIAHAIERVSGYGVPHGEAVAMGLVAETRIAERLGIAERGLADVVSAAVVAAGLPVAPPPTLSPEALVEATRSDKKTRAGTVRYALPEALGRMARGDGRWSVAVADADVLAVLRDG